MSEALKILACKSCLRDNPGEGVFASPENAEKEYRGKLKEGLFRKTAHFELHSCFAECENFHCVRVLKGKVGVHLKQISSPQKIDEVIEWVKLSKQTNSLEVPECLKENLLYEVENSLKVLT